MDWSRTSSGETWQVNVEGLNMQQRFAQGETLLAQGDSGDKTYIVRSGSVLVYRQDGKTGKLIPIKQLGPGDIIGEMYIFNGGEVRSASIVAISDVWGHYHSRIVDDNALISYWARTHEGR